MSQNAFISFHGSRLSETLVGAGPVLAAQQQEARQRKGRPLGAEE